VKTIEQRVADGATFLDMTVPGWWDRIDVKLLDLGNCFKCVLGQLCGDFGDGVVEFNVPDEVELGFDVRCGDLAFDSTLHDQLTGEWRRIILARRAAAAQEQPAEALV
jgi:hypothetical protein